MGLLQYRYIDQWDNKENPQTDLHVYGHLIYHRSSTRVQGGKRSFQKNIVGTKKEHFKKKIDTVD